MKALKILLNAFVFAFILTLLFSLATAQTPTVSISSDEKVYTPKDIAELTVTVKSGNSYIAGAKVSGWLVLEDENKQSFVFTEQTNKYTYDMTFPQDYPHGTYIIVVLAEADGYDPGFASKTVTFKNPITGALEWLYEQQDDDDGVWENDEISNLSINALGLWAISSVTDNDDDLSEVIELLDDDSDYDDALVVERALRVLAFEEYGSEEEDEYVLEDEIDWLADNINWLVADEDWTVTVYNYDPDTNVSFTLSIDGEDLKTDFATKTNVNLDADDSVSYDLEPEAGMTSINLSLTWTNYSVELGFNVSDEDDNPVFNGSDTSALSEEFEITGGWGYRRWQAPDVGNTAFALLALMTSDSDDHEYEADGDDYEDIENAIDFLVDEADSSGDKVHWEAPDSDDNEMVTSLIFTVLEEINDADDDEADNIAEDIDSDYDYNDLEEAICEWLDDQAAASDEDEDDVNNAAWSLFGLFMCADVSEDYSDRIHDMEDFLEDEQESEGFWNTGDSDSDLIDTMFSLLAFSRSYRISVTPANWLVSTTQGQMPTRTFTIENQGKNDLEINISKTGDIADWLALSTTTLTIEPSDDDTFTLTIDIPETAEPGTRSGALSILYDSSAIDIPISIEINETDIASLTPLTWSLQASPGETKSQSFNAGSTTNISSFSVSFGDNNLALSHSAPEYSNNGKNATFTITASPTTSTAAGVYHDNATVLINDEAYVVEITGTISETSELTVSPQTLAFGDFTRGTTKTKSLTLKNDGNTELSVTKTTSGTISEWLSIGDFPEKVTAGQSEAVDLTVTVPEAADFASFSGELTINYGDSTLKVTLSGTVVDMSQAEINAAKLNLKNLSDTITDLGNMGANITNITKLKDTATSLITSAQSDFNNMAFSSSKQKTEEASELISEALAEAKKLEEKLSGWSIWFYLMILGVIAGIVIVFVRYRERSQVQEMYPAQGPEQQLMQAMQYPGAGQMPAPQQPQQQDQYYQIQNMLNQLGQIPPAAPAEMPQATTPPPQQTDQSAQQIPGTSTPESAQTPAPTGNLTPTTTPGSTTNPTPTDASTPDNVKTPSEITKPAQTPGTGDSKQPGDSSQTVVPETQTNTPAQSDSQTPQIGAQAPATKSGTQSTLDGNNLTSGEKKPAGLSGIPGVQKPKSDEERLKKIAEERGVPVDQVVKDGAV